MFFHRVRFSNPQWVKLGARLTEIITTQILCTGSFFFLICGFFAPIVVVLRKRGFLLPIGFCDRKLQLL